MTMHNNVHSLANHSKRLKKPGVSLGKRERRDEDVVFLRDARKVAKKHDCRFLFEFPASLVDSNWDKGAAILCPVPDGYAINFLLFRSKDKEISVINGNDAPVSLVNFACSFANILNVLPICENQSVQ